jgi:hypothetical protein
MSTASLAGACAFAVVTGAGAVFVGDWWGQHHGPVVVQYVGPSNSSARPSHAAEAVRPSAPKQSGTSKTTREVAAEPDANQARSTTGASSPSRSHSGSSGSSHSPGAAARPAPKKAKPAPSATSVAPTQPAPSTSQTTPPATDPTDPPADPGGSVSPGGGRSHGPATGTAS